MHTYVLYTHNYIIGNICLHNYKHVYVLNNASSYNYTYLGMYIISYVHIFSFVYHYQYSIQLMNGEASYVGTVIIYYN